MNRSMVNNSPESRDDDNTTTMPTAECRTCRDSLRRLQKENQQLRRDLADANYRIQQLEFAPSESDYVSADDSSVEVQSVVSTTSSVTTVPTGSSEANRSRLQLQRRQEHREKRDTRRSSQKWRNSALLSSTKYKDMLKRAPVMRQISESEDDSSFSDLVDRSRPISEIRTPASPLERRDSLSSFLASIASEDDDDTASTSDISAILNEVHRNHDNGEI